MGKKKHAVSKKSKNKRSGAVQNANAGTSDYEDDLQAETPEDARDESFEDEGFNLVASKHAHEKNEYLFRVHTWEQQAEQRNAAKLAREKALPEISQKLLDNVALTAEEMDVLTSHYAETVFLEETRPATAKQISVIKEFCTDGDFYPSGGNTVYDNFNDALGDRNTMLKLSLLDILLEQGNYSTAKEIMALKDFTQETFVNYQTLFRDNLSKEILFKRYSKTLNQAEGSITHFQALAFSVFYVAEYARIAADFRKQITLLSNLDPKEIVFFGKRIGIDFELAQRGANVNRLAMDLQTWPEKFSNLRHGAKGIGPVVRSASSTRWVECLEDLKDASQALHATAQAGMTLNFNFEKLKNFERKLFEAQLALDENPNYKTLAVENEAMRRDLGHFIELMANNDTYTNKNKEAFLKALVLKEVHSLPLASLFMQEPYRFLLISLFVTTMQNRVETWLMTLELDKIDCDNKASQVVKNEGPQKGLTMLVDAIDTMYTLDSAPRKLDEPDSLRISEHMPVTENLKSLSSLASLRILSEPLDSASSNESLASSEEEEMPPLEEVAPIKPRDVFLGVLIEDLQSTLDNEESKSSPAQFSPSDEEAADKTPVSVQSWQSDMDMTEPSPLSGESWQSIDSDDSPLDWVDYSDEWLDESSKAFTTHWESKNSGGKKGKGSRNNSEETTDNEAVTLDQFPDMIDNDLIKLLYKKSDQGRELKLKEVKIIIKLLGGTISQTKSGEMYTIEPNNATLVGLCKALKHTLPDKVRPAIVSTHEQRGKNGKGMGDNALAGVEANELFKQLGLRFGLTWEVMMKVVKHKPVAAYRY